MQKMAEGLVRWIVLGCMMGGLCEGWLMPSWWSTCYHSPPIGCFPTSYPYNNTGGIAPQDPDTIGVEFYFHDSSGPPRLFNLEEADQILQRDYNSTAKTAVIIHGYFENGFSSWIRDLANELKQNDSHMNVVVVNWDGGSSNLIYHQSVANARVAGAVIGLFLQKLVSLGGDKSNFHMIGFSLGAHVAGYVGSSLPGLGRITGLDPARPGFLHAPPQARLDPTDAVLVDVIHTDADPIVGIGILEPTGTVDFYPNGGANQPGCPVSVMDRFSAVLSAFDFSSDSIKTAVGCSHLRVTSLFTASIRNNCFLASQRCPTFSDFLNDSCSVCQPGACPSMGYQVDVTTCHLPGVYLIATASSPPFC